MKSFFSHEAFFLHGIRASNLVLSYRVFLLWGFILFLLRSFFSFRPQILGTSIHMIMRAPSKLHTMTFFISAQNMLRLTATSSHFYHVTLPLQSVSSTNQLVNEHTKYIEIFCYFIKLHLRHAIHYLQRVDSANQLADIFIKSQPPSSLSENSICFTVHFEFERKRW